MKNKLTTVSVGIPALNEEGNIKKLLLSILGQKADTFRLEKIIVVSDGSTDRTVEEILSVKNNKIHLINNKTRIGQALSQNKIIALNKSDVMVLLNADVLPKNDKFLKEIISPLLNKNKAGLVGAKVEPVGSDTFIGEIIDFSSEVKHRLYSQKNGGNNIYNCHGRARAFSKTFLSDFKWNKTVAEDAFSYFSCLSLGFEFVYQPNAIVLYKSPQTIQDHMNQSIRFIQSRAQMEKFFDPNFVRKEYAFTAKEFMKEVLAFLLKNPVLFVSYCALYLWAKLQSRVSQMTDVKWEVSKSSKVVAP